MNVRPAGYWTSEFLALRLVVFWSIGDTITAETLLLPGVILPRDVKFTLWRKSMWTVCSEGLVQSFPGEVQHRGTEGTFSAGNQLFLMAFLFSDIALRFSGSHMWDCSVGNRALYFKLFITGIYDKEVIVLALMNRSTSHTDYTTYSIFWVQCSEVCLHWTRFLSEWYIGHAAEVALNPLAH